VHRLPTVAFLGALAACVPSRAALLEPVASDVKARAGLPLGNADPAQVAALLARPLDADGAARVALLRRPKVAAALEEVGASAADLAAQLAPKHIELEAELRRDSDRDTTTIELSAMLDLVELVSIPARRGAGRAGLAAARARAARTAIDVASEARAAQVRAAAAARLLELRTRSFEAADASCALARSLRQASNITELALALEEARCEQARLDLAAAQMENASARNRLAAALGLRAPDIESLAVAPLGDTRGLPDDAGQLESQAVGQSLELAELRSRAEAAARRVGLARWHSVLPGLGAGVSAEREEGSWGVGPAVSLAIPLFDWGQGERGRTWAELRQVRELYRERALAVRAGARAAAQRLVGSRERADHLRTVLVPLRRRIVDATLLQYNAMQASPFELIQARQAEIDAEVRLVEALRDAHLAAGDVDRLSAGGAAEP
jgi:outer membrane protein TolC